MQILTETELDHVVGGKIISFNWGAAAAGATIGTLAGGPGVGVVGGFLAGAYL